MIAGDYALGQHTAMSRAQRARAIVIGTVTAAALAFVFAFQSTPEPPLLVAGQISPRTILAPERVTFASQIETNDARAKAESAVADAYDPPSAEIAREQIRMANRVFEHIDSVRHDTFSTPEQKLEWVRAIPAVTLPTLTLSRTLALDENSFHRVVSEAQYVLDVTMRDEIRPNDVAAESGKVPSRVSLALSAEQADLVTQWTRNFIVSNSSFNAAKTVELRAQARERVGTVYRTVEKGEAVLREGEFVTPKAVEALEALGIMRPRPVLADYAGPALFGLLLALLFSAYILRLRPGLVTHPRALLLVAFLLIAATIGARLLVPNRPVLLYLYPVAAAVMLIAVLVDSVTAFGMAVVLGLMVGFQSHNSLEMTTYVLLGGVIAALNLGRIERLPVFLWTGAYVALSNAVVVAIFRVVAHDEDLSTWGQPLLASLGNGFLSAFVAIGSLFILGKVFGITTSLELVDLARPTHPLLQKLLRDAPGTYHHSLVVSQLAEHAAQSIGADALLVRVASYYHDVGKTREPQMFIENQLEGVNVHDTLEPWESATIVIDHIARGLALAREHRLPKRLRDFIPQHHGTTLAAYFHRKAVQNNGNQPVDETLYRYPGPKPQSREAGVLMLADGIEATTRAERPSTPEGINKIVERIVNERLRDGQLDESDLTLRDIQQIKAAFFDVLQGLYHSRVKYPEPPMLAAGAPILGISAPGLPPPSDSNEPPERMNAG